MVTHLKELQGVVVRIFDPSTQVTVADGSPEFRADLQPGLHRQDIQDYIIRPSLREGVGGQRDT